VTVLLLAAGLLCLLPPALLGTWRLAFLSSASRLARAWETRAAERPPTLEQGRGRDGAGGPGSPQEQRIQDLERQVEELRNLLVRTRSELAGARQRLEQLAEVREYLPALRVLSAEVLVRPGGLPLGGDAVRGAAIAVNRGRNDGVDVGDVVLQGQAVVGQVVEADAHAARALLISSPRSVLAARLGRTRTECYVRGAAQGGCEAVFLGRPPEAQAGDMVFTSGLLGYAPPDLLIGQLTGPPVASRDRRTHVAPLQPRADLNALETVLVVRRTDVDVDTP